jgi:hypothetical protein
MAACMDGWIVFRMLFFVHLCRYCGAISIIHPSCTFPMALLTDRIHILYAPWRQTLSEEKEGFISCGVVHCISALTAGGVKNRDDNFMTNISKEG